MPPRYPQAVPFKQAIPRQVQVWLLDRDGKLTATLGDGRCLHLGRDDVADIIG